MKYSTNKIIGAVIVLALIACTFAVWKLHSPTSTTPPADKAALVQLQADLQNVTPHFVDSSKANGQKLTPEEQKIKDDVVAVLVAGQPDNKDYYSGLWLDAIGKGYILISQPSAESSFDEIMDSQTGKVTNIPGEARYYLASTGRNIALYIDTQAIRTYTLDQADAVVVKGSELLGTETYHSGEADNPGIIPRMSWTPNSITITIFDSSKRQPNPKLGEGATMNGVVREVTLNF